MVWNLFQKNKNRASNRVHSVVHIQFLLTIKDLTSLFYWWGKMRKGKNKLPSCVNRIDDTKLQIYANPSMYHMIQNAVIHDVIWIVNCKILITMAYWGRILYVFLYP